MADDAHPCPTCGKRLPTERGKKIHHARTHGESLADHYEWDCEVCGEHCSRLKSEIDDEYPPRYCGDECHEEAVEESGVELVCEHCEEPFRVPPSRAEGRRFCEMDCFREYSETHRRAELVCDRCGDPFTVPRSESHRRQTCGCNSSAPAEVTAGD